MLKEPVMRKFFAIVAAIVVVAPAAYAAIFQAAQILA